jgi:hypothetical protein
LRESAALLLGRWAESESGTVSARPATASVRAMERVITILR